MNGTEHTKSSGLLLSRTPESKCVIQTFGPPSTASFPLSEEPDGASGSKCDRESDGKEVLTGVIVVGAIAA